MRILEGQEKWEPAGIPIGALIHLTSARVQPKHTHTHPVASGQQYYIVACDPLWKSSDHGFLPPSAKSYSIAPTLKEVKGSPNWSVCNWDCLECVLKTLISGTYDQIPGNMGAGFVTSYRLGIFVLSETQSATASIYSKIFPLIWQDFRKKCCFSIRLKMSCEQAWRNIQYIFNSKTTVINYFPTIFLSEFWHLEYIFKGLHYVFLNI